MKQYPNYRVSVEVVIKKGGKVLLAKRADDADVAPGEWCVPAGKVKYEEIPTAAVLREAKEETGLDVRLIAEIGCRAFKMKAKGEDAFRLVYTYLVEPTTDDDARIDEEHSEFSWVDQSELNDVRYASLLPELSNIIKEKAF